MKKKYIICFALSLILFLLCTPLRAWSFINASIIETILYATVTYTILSKLSKNKKETIIITMAIIAGRICIELPLRIKDFSQTLVSLPGTFLACLSILLAALIYATVKNRKYIVVPVVLAWGYCIFWEHKKCLEYITWGTTPDVNLSTFVITTEKGRTRLDSLKKDYILLDFWSSTCGICYKKFPEIQSLYDRNEDKITAVSIFVPYLKEEQEADGKPIIDKYGYTFPVWSVPSGDTLLKVLKIDCFPTVILLDKDRNVIFKGNLENAKKKLESIIN